MSVMVFNRYFRELMMKKTFIIFRNPTIFAQECTITISFNYNQTNKSQLVTARHVAATSGWPHPHGLRGDRLREELREGRCDLSHPYNLLAFHLLYIYNARYVRTKRCFVYKCARHRLIRRASPDVARHVPTNQSVTVCINSTHPAWSARNCGENKKWSSSSRRRPRVKSFFNLSK